MKHTQKPKAGSKLIKVSSTYGGGSNPLKRKPMKDDKFFKKKPNTKRKKK